MTVGEKVIRFNQNLEFSGTLPQGVEVMNPFRNNAYAMHVSEQFYTRFYHDNNPRTLLLGINPGRFGAGSTGIPFTDTIRLNEKCGIPFPYFRTYEPSSAFMYEMIDAYGGVNDFLGKFLMGAICPLGFTMVNNKGKAVNYNYYDHPALTQAVSNFILTTLQQQLDFGINRKICICLGTGKNELFLRRLNKEYKVFSEVIALEHPRYIMQYKSKSKKTYIDKYLSVLHAL